MDDAKPGTEVVEAKKVSRTTQLVTLFYAHKERYQRLLPDEKTLDRFVEIAAARIGRNDKLFRCHPTSIALAFSHVAELQLDPSPSLALVAFIPRWNSKLKDPQTKKEGCFELTVMTTYKGMSELVMRSGDIVSIDGAVVYQKDEFEFERGLTPRLRHVQSLDTDPGPMVAAWVMLRFRDQSLPPLWEVMPAWRILKVRDVAGGEVWKNWEDEMAVKTVLKHRCKLIPMLTWANKAAAIEDAETVDAPEVGAITTRDLEDDYADSNGDRTEPQTKADEVLGQLEARPTVPQSADVQAADAQRAAQQRFGKGGA